MILEGLNVLQTAPRAAGPDAVRLGLLRLLDLHRRRREDIEQWYVDRFMTLRETVFTDAEVVLPPLREPERSRKRGSGARGIWREINYVNLKENIEPTRERAHLILEKDGQHLVQSVRLRKL